MVLDTAKLKNRKEYYIGWNAWKRCCKRVDSQGEPFTGIHDRFLRDQVYRESQLAIGWTEQKCKEMDELARQNHTYHLSPVEFKRYQGQWYLTLDKSGKMGLCDFDPIFELRSLSKTVFIVLQHNTEDGTLPQAIPGETCLDGVGGAHIIMLSDLFFVTVGFGDSRWRSTVTDGGCRQIHLTRHFSRTFAHISSLFTCTAWLNVLFFFFVNWESHTLAQNAKTMKHRWEDHPLTRGEFRY